MDDLRLWFVLASLSCGVGALVEGAERTSTTGRWLFFLAMLLALPPTLAMGHAIVFGSYSWTMWASQVWIAAGVATGGHFLWCLWEKLKWERSVIKEASLFTAVRAFLCALLLLRAAFVRA